ncbi:MAG: hypothetical protein AMS22_08460 [Thiotrichales bacterium SG8_50]|nr:MAG: hypothetical protein AMS22_08460 [Thiotrichales bacterium SG8_50]
MSKYMVKLRPSQQTVRPFKHDLLNDVEPLETEEVDLLVGPALAGCKEARDGLVLGHLAMLRHTIGRYLHHWPVTRRFLDDMVSAGLLAMTRAIGNLQPATLVSQTVGQYLLNHICAAVEDEVARLRGICPAAPSTNRKYSRLGRDPVYGVVESDVTDNGHAYLEPRFTEFEVLEGVEQLKREAGICALLLDRSLWGLTCEEVSDRLGISRWTVYRNRAKLHQRYLELIGEIDG